MDLKTPFCIRVEFSQKDLKTCSIMNEISGSEFEIDADLIILAGRILALHIDKYLTS